MNLFDVSPTRAHAVLRAIKTVALASGAYDDGERALVRAAASAFGVDADDASLEPIRGDELAAAIASHDERLRALQACMLMTVADAAVTPPELAVLDEYRVALGVDEPRVQVLRAIAHDHQRLARFHMLRLGEGGRSQLKGARLTEMLRAFKLLPTDEAVTQRFRALRELPDGTLGREYHRYAERNGFGMPGERGGIPEAGVHHDLTHVLTGYDTDPLGEIEIGSFTAGMKKTDPFFFLLFVMLEFHLGLAIRPGQPAAPGHYDAARAVRAHQRGARCTRDLTNGWDFWPDVARPVTELRREFGIAD
jgi:hypothetical protein